MIMQVLIILTFVFRLQRRFPAIDFEFVVRRRKRTDELECQNRSFRISLPLHMIRCIFW